MLHSVIVQTQIDRRQDPRNPLRTINLSNGTMSDRFALPTARGGWDPSGLSQLIVDDQRVFAMFSASDFSTMNGRWNSSKSGTLADRLEKNPEEWEQYHTLYRSARESWRVFCSGSRPTTP